MRNAFCFDDDNKQLSLFWCFVLSSSRQAGSFRAKKATKKFESHASNLGSAWSSSVQTSAYVSTTIALAIDINVIGGLFAVFVIRHDSAPIISCN